jgi:hypothetical protein
MRLSREHRRRLKIATLAEEALRAVAHHRGMEARDFSNAPEIAQAKQTIQNGLLELFTVKFHILFSIRKGDKHRLASFNGLEERFLAALGDAKAVESFTAYSENIAKYRDINVVHVDEPEKVDAASAAGLRYPNLDEGAQYVICLHDIINKKGDGADRFEELMAAAQTSWENTQRN